MLQGEVYGRNTRREQRAAPILAEAARLRGYLPYMGLVSRLGCRNDRLDGHDDGCRSHEQGEATDYAEHVVR